MESSTCIYYKTDDINKIYVDIYNDWWYNLLSHCDTDYFGSKYKLDKKFFEDCNYYYYHKYDKEIKCPSMQIEDIKLLVNQFESLETLGDISQYVFIIEEINDKNTFRL